MSKTEAAEIVATNVLAFAHKYNVALTKDLVEARMSEMRVTTAAGSPAHQAAFSANWRTTLATAKKWAV